LLAKNGEPIVATESYAKKAGAMKAASMLATWVSTALLVDRDMKAEVVKKTTASVSKKAEKKVSTPAKK